MYLSDLILYSISVLPNSLDKFEIYLIIVKVMELHTS